MSSIKIMILEDELGLAHTLSAALEKSLGAECKTKICTTAEAALQMLQIHSFDLIISDWRLPSMSGLDFITQVRQSMPDMPIIFMTAFSTDLAKEQVEALSGCFIEKPFEIPDLLYNVYQLLGLSQAETAAVEQAPALARTRHILILEDDESLSNLYQKVFRKNNYEIYSAKSFAEANRHLKQQKFDLFLCDVKLGDGFGIDLLQIWGKQLLENNTKTIVVSGDPWYRLVSEELGASFFFRKPVEMNALIQLAKSLVP
jgi:DNA-binding NtrC family response regulator